MLPLSTASADSRPSIRPGEVPDTRTRILDLAEELLLARGFQAFSYQHIARALGVKPAAIHYHFPTKEDLGVALVQRQHHRLQKWRALPRVTDLPPADRLRALFEVYRGHLRRDRRLCLFGALAGGFDVLPDPMRTALRSFTAELMNWLATVLAEGRSTQAITFVGQPEAKAAQLLTTLAGALQVARVHDERQFALIEKQLLLELLNGPA